MASEPSKDFEWANLQFTLDLYKALPQSESGNVFFSPFSISTALAMVYQGAKGDTAAELGKGLCYESVDNVPESFRDLLSSLKSDDSGESLVSANRLCIQDNYPVLPAFLETLTKHFSSEPHICDFAKNCEAVRQEINSWVSTTTRNHITDLLPPGSLDTLTRLVIVNAIFFKGQWTSMFDSKRTRSGKFFKKPSETINVDMMHQKAKYYYGESDALGCRILELPYNGGMSMVVVLPMEDHRLDRVESRLNAENVSSLLRETSKMEVMLSLPRFKIKQDIELVKTLQQLGVKKLFSETECDLSGIDDSRLLYVSNVFHQAFVDVNEEGTTAAAATAVVVQMRCVVRTMEFNVNQPFLFMIRHCKSNSVLFFGKVTSPSSD